MAEQLRQAMLGWVTPLGTDTHPMVFQMPPQLETGRHQTSEHHYHLGTTKRPPLAEGAGVDERFLLSHFGGARAEQGAPLPLRTAGSWKTPRCPPEPRP